MKSTRWARMVAVCCLLAALLSGRPAYAEMARAERVAGHADRIRTLLAGEDVTEADRAGVVFEARLAFQAGLLRPTLAAIVAEDGSLSAVLDGLEPRARAFVVLLAAADAHGRPDERWARTLDALPEDESARLLALAAGHDFESAAFKARAAAELGGDTPESRRLVDRLLAQPGGYAAARQAGLVLPLFLSRVGSRSLQAGLLADMSSPDRDLAARAAHQARIIGVVSPQAFEELVADPAFDTAAHEALSRNLCRMRVGPKRAALQSIVARHVPGRAVRLSTCVGSDCGGGDGERGGRGDGTVCRR